ncbi:MAG: beta-hydroxyacyl-ACP dehydratase [Synergistaceae bacterium]|jgi:3-hydroxyacyl-[acyl-carrier-protein] dehydratase|nr:beta-hydroxyacyl-ACP dehydratase [Synergistaceae bacterium]
MKLDRDGVMEVLPHRGVMLMVDGIEELDYGKRVVGYRDVGAGEFWCDGHFPDRPILPGALIIEMMAQVCAFLFVGEEGRERKIPYIAKVEEVKFLDKVYPNSRLVVEALFDAEGAGFVRAKCTALCGGKPAARGKLTCRLSGDGRTEE